MSLQLNFIAITLNSARVISLQQLDHHGVKRVSVDLELHPLLKEHGDPYLFYFY